MSEGPERPGHLSLRSQIDGGGSLQERVLLGRQLEPVDERRRARQRLAVHELRARQPERFAEADEELGMREIAARDAPGLLLVEALGQQHAFDRVRTPGMQRAHGPRELPDLEEELDRKARQAGGVDPALLDAMPQRMTAEAASLPDQAQQRVRKRARVEGSCHTARLPHGAGRHHAGAGGFAFCSWMIW
jgi:hypothetical protein